MASPLFSERDIARRIQDAPAAMPDLTVFSTGLCRGRAPPSAGFTTLRAANDNRLVGAKLRIQRLWVNPSRPTTIG